VKNLMVRSAAKPRVSNHEVRMRSSFETPACGRLLRMRLRETSAYGQLLRMSLQKTPALGRLLG